MLCCINVILNKNIILNLCMFIKSDKIKKFSNKLYLVNISITDLYFYSSRLVKMGLRVAYT